MKHCNQLQNFDLIGMNNVTYNCLRTYREINQMSRAKLLIVVKVFIRALRKRGWVSVTLYEV